MTSYLRLASLLEHAAKLLREADERLSQLHPSPMDCIDFSKLSVRGRKCLRRMGCSTLFELAAKSEEDVWLQKNVGMTTLAELRGLLAQNGMKFNCPLGVSERGDSLNGGQS